MSGDQGTIKKRVDEVKVDDLLDFEGDEYADPGVIDDDETGEPRLHGNPAFEFEFARVAEIERSEFRVRLHTSLGSFDFPPGHLVECF
jgi:hypothetical protein